MCVTPTVTSAPDLCRHGRGSSRVEDPDSCRQLSHSWGPELCAHWSLIHPLISNLSFGLFYILRTELRVSCRLGRLPAANPHPRPQGLGKKGLKQGLLKLSGLASDFSPALVSGVGWICWHAPPHPCRHIFVLFNWIVGLFLTVFFLPSNLVSAFGFSFCPTRLSFAK